MRFKIGLLPALLAAMAGALLLPSRIVAQETNDARTGSPWNVDWGSINDDEEAWTLSDWLHSPIDVGGWANAGFTTNAHGNRTGIGNAPLTANDVADAPVMNQLWIYAEKPLDFECRSINSIRRPRKALEMAFAESLLTIDMMTEQAPP